LLDGLLYVEDAVLRVLMKRITDAEYLEFLKLKTLKTESPKSVVANIIDRIRTELEASAMDEIELAKAVGMQPAHLRKVLSKVNSSDPKMTTLVKIANGLNLSFYMKAIK
jgi:DNA-binding phage protein